jgi:uncharacterized protein YjbI with pentapeptide repeats
MCALRFKSFRGYKFVNVDFTEADLTGCDFSGATFDGCRLSSVVMSGALTRFDGADLRGAVLANPQLGQVSLWGAMITARQAKFLLEERLGVIIVDE